jgi:hypothetical protein
LPVGENVLQPIGKILIFEGDFKIFSAVNCLYN